jgi:hypothetical protein
MLLRSSLLGLFLGAVCLGQERLPFEGTAPVRALPGQVDVSAILRTWRVKGVLVCPHRGRQKPCLWVENAFPCGIFEVVHQPFRTHVTESEPAMAALRLLPLSLTSAAGADKAQTNLQFADAHVFTYVPPVDDIDWPIASPKGFPFAINYLSEIDAFAWRTGLIDRLIRPAPLLSCETAPDKAKCAGRWGAYYPREGYLIHSSEPKSAFLQAVRAGRVASDPLGRFVPLPYPFEPRTGHLIQMIRPVWRRAVRIGEPGPIDEGAGSLYGGYLFIHFGIFEECRRCLPPRLVGPK